MDFEEQKVYIENSRFLRNKAVKTVQHIWLYVMLYNAKREEKIMYEEVWDAWTLSEVILAGSDERALINRKKIRKS